MPTRVAAALVACALAAPALAGVDRCPRLPVDSHLQWVYRAGPDFDLCYAQYDDTTREAFGLYLGYAPSLRIEERTVVEPGTIGGYPVQWVLAKPQASDRPYGREALLRLANANGNPPLQVHVWAYAASPAELAQALAVLRDITFR